MSETSPGEPRMDSETPRAAIPRSELGHSIDPLFEAMKQNSGDFELSLESCRSTIPDDTHDRVRFVHDLAEIFDDSALAVHAITSKNTVWSLKDLAAKFGKSDFIELFNPISAHIRKHLTPGDAPAESDLSSLISTTFNKFFAAMPSEVLERMIRIRALAIPDASIRAGVRDFFANQPGFNIRRQSLFTAAAAPDAYKNIPKMQQPAVFDFLCKLQRTRALVPTPEAYRPL